MRAPRLRRPSAGRARTPLMLTAGMLALAAILTAGAPTGAPSPPASRDAALGRASAGAPTGAPSPPASRDAALGRVSAAARQCQVPYPQTADEWAAVLDGRLDDGTAYAADGAISLRIDDRTVAWLWADTLSGTPAGAGIAVDGASSSSVTVQHDGCMSPGAGELIASTPDTGHWPVSATATDDGHAIVFLARVARGTGPMDFRITGTEVVTGHLDPVHGLTVETSASISDDLNDHDTRWGAGTAVHDGHLYVWGTRREAGAFGNAVTLARTTPDRAADRTTWQYWDGTGWTSQEQRAATLIEAVGGPDTDLTVQVGVDGRVRFASKRDGALGQDVHLWTADRPTGPYADAGRIARTGGWDASGTVTYGIRAHEGLEVLLPDGTSHQLITANHNDTSPQAPARIQADRSAYLPSVVPARLPAWPSRQSAAAQRRTVQP